MIIPKNTLLRSKDAKAITEIPGYEDAVKKYKTKQLDDDHSYRKKVNANLRKRLDSLFHGDMINEEEVVDFLSLLEHLLILHNIDIDDMMKKRFYRDHEYGTYSTRRYTTVDIDDERFDDLSFIPYSKTVKMTKKLKEAMEFPDEVEGAQKQRKEKAALYK